MNEKPRTASEYPRKQTELVIRACLYVATKLGDLMEELVVVGGLVPTLLIPEKELALGTDIHAGSMDLDIGIALSLLKEKRYEEITKRLRRAEFEPDFNEEGNLTRQRWKIERQGCGRVTVDFLIAPSLSGDNGGQIQNIEQDFAAVITKGLSLAFQDRREIYLEGTTIFNEKARRKIWVCGPGAFIVLKALAFNSRGENKDAYDLFYMVRNFGQSVDDVYNSLKPIINEKETREALEILRRDFLDHDAVGPSRVAAFIGNVEDEGIKSDVVGFTKELISKCGIS
jgi:hypothetical protein